MSLFDRYLMSGKSKFKVLVSGYLMLLILSLVSIDEKVQSVTQKEEENTMVDKAIGIYINEMIKHTMKVFTLSVALA